MLQSYPNNQANFLLDYFSNSDQLYNNCIKLNDQFETYKQWKSIIKTNPKLQLNRYITRTYLSVVQCTYLLLDAILFDTTCKTKNGGQPLNQIFASDSTYRANELDSNYCFLEACQQMIELKQYDNTKQKSNLIELAKTLKADWDKNIAPAFNQIKAVRRYIAHLQSTDQTPDTINSKTLTTEKMGNINMFINNITTFIQLYRGKEAHIVLVGAEPLKDALSCL